MGKDTKLRPDFYSFLALFIGIGIALLFAEGIIRSSSLSKTWNGKQQEQLHHEIIKKYIINYDAIGYTFQPNVSFNFIRGEHYQINDEGFRDKPFSILKKKKRVAIIGDSVIEGFGVEKQDRISDIVAKSFPNMELFNFGMGGYSTFDAFHILKQKVSRYQPEILLIQVCHNDLEHNFNINQALADTDSLKIKASLENPSEHEESTKTSFWKDFLRNNSALYLFLAERYQYNKLQHNQPNPLLEEILQTNPHHWTVSTEIWKQMISYCNQQNIKPVFIYIPYECEIQITDDSLGNYFTDRMMSFCQKESVAFVDVTKELRQFRRSGELYFDHCHLDVSGNKIVAKKVSGFFINSYPWIIR